MKFVPFTSSDWDCYAGAESFDNGMLPLINSETPNVFIIDKNGVEAYLYTGDDDEPDVYHADSIQAVLFVQSHDPKISGDELLSEGFVCLYKNPNA